MPEIQDENVILRCMVKTPPPPATAWVRGGQSLIPDTIVEFKAPLARKYALRSVVEILPDQEPEAAPAPEESPEPALMVNEPPVELPEATPGLLESSEPPAVDLGGNETEGKTKKHK